MQLPKRGCERIFDVFSQPLYFISFVLTVLRTPFAVLGNSYPAHTFLAIHTFIPVTFVVAAVECAFIAIFQSAYIAWMHSVIHRFIPFHGWIR